MKKLKKYILTELYPLDRSASFRWRSILFFGLFVFLFLLIFQPFGLNNDFPDKPIILLGYGVLTSLGVWIFNMVLPHLFPGFFTEEKWYVWKELSVTMAAILFIAFLNLLYSYFLGFFQFNLLNFIVFIGITFALGVFPVTISILLNYTYKLKKHQQDAAFYSSGTKETSRQAKESSSNILTLTNDNSEALGSWKVENILRIEAAQNYVEVYSFTNSNEITRDLIRMNLKEVENQTKPFECLLRTHRSHIVNLDHIRDVRGNAQGLQLTLKGSNDTVPVSRSRISNFKEYSK